MKICIVHDYLFQMGGAEKVVEELHDIYPDAPVYTSIYRPDRVSDRFREMDIRTSFLQRFAWMDQHARKLLPLYPMAFEHLDLRGYDVVISSSSAFAKGVVTAPRTRHICYCYTPMRFAWMYHSYVERERLGGTARRVLPFMVNNLRTWDESSAGRVDGFIAISECVAQRIRKFYRRQASVIYPPVDVESFNTIPRLGSEYYLIVSRLVPYKRIDTAVEAFNSLGLPLKIVGDGRDRQRLQSLAGPNIEFLGYRIQEEVRELYSRAAALIFPGCEDFGITPIESQAAGCPVIAYADGGAMETIEPGVGGVLYTAQSGEALAEAVRAMDPSSFPVQEMRLSAARFSSSRFRQAIRDYIDRDAAEFLS